MQCPKCGKTGFVTLSGKRYCSNCGSKLDASAAPTATMSDIKPTGKALDLRSSTPVVTKSAAAVTAAAGKPSGQFHGQPGVGTGVLDLRGARATAPSARAPVIPTQVVTPSARVTPASTPAPAPTATAAPAPIQAPSPQPAASVPTPTITPKAPLSTPQVTSGPAKSTTLQLTAPSTSAVRQSPMINKYPGRPGATQATGAVLPEAVATQVDTMKSQVATPPPQPQSPALRQALSAAKQSTTTPTVFKIGAALVAIGVMSGIVWMQNSPKLAFRNAAAQAGIAASLPTFVPSSYHQTGPLNVSPGALTLNFASPSIGQPLKIIQRRSDWDANALRENYISAQTTNFLAVQGQGLTIYLDSDQANWMNHGVWYQLSGISKLNRDDVLKIAYGL